MKFDPQYIKGIFLDLDDTLYDYQSCNEAGQQSVFKFLAKSLNRSYEEIQHIFNYARAQVKESLKIRLGFVVAASHSRLLYFQKTIETLTGKSNSALTLRSEQVFWNTFIDTMKLFPKARSFLKGIKASGRILVIVTNMTAQIQHRKLIRLNIDQLVDFMVTSEESGREKPHPATLDLALEKTKLKPSQVVMVGEDAKQDIPSAQAANITPIALRFRPSDRNVLFAKNFMELSRFFKI